MPQYQTPGVYVEEVSTLPPSVVEVSTAIPAFIGCTHRGGTSSAPGVARISSLLEFEQKFGGPPLSQFTVDATGPQLVVTRASTYRSILYDCVNLFFQNGGGSCYVVSIGDFSAKPTKDAFTHGLGALSKEDEPTLLVLSEAAHALTTAHYGEVALAALGQCASLADRFAILDVKEESAQGDHGIADFRMSITDHLRYGAAYFPNLQTTLQYRYVDTGVTVTLNGPAPVAPKAKQSPKAKKAGGESSTQLTTHDETLDAIKTGNSALYSRIKAALAQQRIILPPAAAVAGAYCRVDRERGVWNSPANIGLAAVLGPTVKLTDAEQASLNVDAVSGKSINAIRAFAGKGTLIWGARTLEGNSNEWRYVSVRRLFNMLEESCKKATQFAVFEPNDLSTWLKVKGMIESYLFDLWEDGAFAGTTPEEAYFVHVGLGVTMDQDDVREGKMIVEVGVAAVRPAEFIVLRFSHLTENP